MIEHLSSAEDVAREWEGCDREEYADGAACRTHDLPWPCADQAVLNVADLIRARDAEVRADERAKVRYVVFDSDWCEPPGDVIAVFATEAEARAHIDGPGDGHGWSVVEVPAP